MNDAERDEVRAVLERAEESCREAARALDRGEWHTVWTHAEAARYLASDAEKVAKRAARPTRKASRKIGGEAGA